MLSTDMTSEAVRAVWRDPDLTRPQAAALLGLTVNQLRKKARRLGLPMREPVDLRSEIRRLTDDEVRAIWGRDDLSRDEQAKLAGVAVSCLTTHARRLGLPMRAEARDRRIPASRIRELWLDPDLTTRQVAEIVGLSRVNLWHRAKALGLPARKPGTRFAIAAGSEKERQFREMWEAPVRASDIANAFGIHPLTVCKYARHLQLTRRTHPGRLITIEEYHRRRQYDELRRAMQATAAGDNLQLVRLAQEDLDEEPYPHRLDAAGRRRRRKCN